MLKKAIIALSVFVATGYVCAENQPTPAATAAVTPEVTSSETKTTEIVTPSQPTEPSTNPAQVTPNGKTEGFFAGLQSKISGLAPESISQFCAAHPYIVYGTATVAVVAAAVAIYNKLTAENEEAAEWND